MKKTPRAVGCAVLAAALLGPHGAFARHRAVIADPDGFVNVRSDSNADAAVVAKVEAGEVFTFECGQEADWCKVKLPSGKAGWMHRSRIRLHFTEKDLPKAAKKSESSEVDELARRHGFDYSAVTRGAARGQAKALKQFFEMTEAADGAAAESHYEVPTAVYHILGDEKFARFLAAQPIAFRMLVRSEILSDGPMAPVDTYQRQHFPETTKTLFQREIIDWPSPDGRYAIRKVFSEEFDLGGSKVVQAEVIEKGSGRVLGDLTRDDIGTGWDREGAVFWSPDSKRFAFLSSNLTEAGNLSDTPRPAPKRKQTAVYQFAGESFVRVELPLTEVPGRDGDAEVADAIPGHEYTEPIRWDKPNVLVLQRHEYFRTTKPVAIEGMTAKSIKSFDRLYNITATFGGDRTGSLTWQKREDPP